MQRPYARPWIANRRQALVLASALWLAGALVLFDSYERRGIKRPAPLRVFANVPSVF